MAEQVAIMKYRTLKSNHDRVLAASRAYLDYEHAHPETFHYNSTRYYFRDVPGNPEEEQWMFIDYFDDFDDYMASLQQAQKTDPQAQEHARAFFAEIIPGSLERPRELWTEAESLRVDF
jgi:hypothetical protein